MPDKPSRPEKQRKDTTAQKKITEKEMIDILKRARETVKPLVNHEAANEVVGEAILNFRMNA